MKYKDFIKVNESFQYSINLQYDYNKLNKIDAYIPTNMSIEILNEYIKSIYYSNNVRARVLIGPYGKGKSHLMLILLALLTINDNNYHKYGKESRQIIENLIEKISMINYETGELIRNTRKEKKRFLTVIINCNYSDLKQAFLISVVDALNREHLNHLIPNTYFEVVKTTVIMWKNKYINTYKSFVKELKNKGVNINDFITKINAFNEEAYLMFKEIHPKVTAGTEFNPLVNSDVTTLYNEINDRICNEGNYSGMFIVFDEFSKFLVSGVNADDTINVKILQDFAELANRSSVNQFHITCITHKSIDDYISQLTKEKIDTWRAVEGRFKEVYFTASSEQNYELIGNSIIKDKDKFQRFKNLNKEKYSLVINDASRYGIFKDISNYEKIIGEDCFPLNPLTTYVLPRVSEKVAQNERTLFTFLSVNDKGSLIEFMNRNKGELNFVGLDSIYDYFEALFKKEVFNNYVHSVWLESNIALKKVDDLNEKRVIKALAIIKIVDEFEKLAPTDNFIKLSINMDNKTYYETIEKLFNNGVLIKRKRKNYYDFINISDVNLQQAIKDTIELKCKNIDFRETLDEIINLGYELPKRHNDKFEMIRFYKKIFIISNELLDIIDADSLIEYFNSDGLIAYLIYNYEKEKQKIIDKLKKLNNKKLLVVIPDKPFNKFDSIKEYYAIKYLINDNNFVQQDESILQELNIRKMDVILDLKNYIDKHFNLNNGKCRYYNWEGEMTDIINDSHVSKKISKICDSVFNCTPVINNELINKNNISSQILRAREKVIRFIFEGDDKLLSSTPNSPEATIYRATIKNKGLDINSNIINSNDGNLKKVLEEIKKFVLSAEDKEKSFDILYSLLKSVPYGIRKGIIPIYLSCIMKEFKDKIIIYKNKKEIELDVNALNKINDNPESYSMIIESGTKEKLRYLEDLEVLFKEYEIADTYGYNKFGYIVNLMKSWMRSLSKYTREYKVEYCNNKFVDLDINIQRFRVELLKLDINPRDLIINIIPKKVLKEKSFSNCIKRIKIIKNQLDVHIKRLKKELICYTKDIFKYNYEGELSSALIDWYKGLNDISKAYLYDIDINRALDFIKNLRNYDENYVIDKLAYIFTGLRIEDWKDDTLKEYLQRLNNMKEKVEENKEEVKGKNDENFKIVFYKNGKEEEKLLKIIDIDGTATNLYNEVEEIFDDFGQSMTIDEKRNVLIHLLQKLM